MWDYDRYYRRRYPRYYDFYQPSYYQQQLFDSNYSDISQSIYNLGYMQGVTQNAIVNQSINDRYRY